MHLLGIESVVLVVLRMFSLKWSTEGTFVLSFRVFILGKYDRRIMSCFRIEHVHKTGSWHPSEVLFKISNEHQHPAQARVQLCLPKNFSRARSCKILFASFSVSFNGLVCKNVSLVFLMQVLDSCPSESYYKLKVLNNKKN